MAWVRWSIVFLLVFGLGVLFGPLLTAAIGALRHESDPGVPLAGAMRLLETYEAPLPETAPPAGMSWEAAARSCGYDPAAVMDAEVAPGAAWSPALGYFDLRMWQGSEARADLRAGRAERLARAMTPFQQRFYRDCMVASVFAPLCRRQVSAVLADTAAAGGAAAPKPAGGAPAPRNRETICHFLDGVAARRGLPLALREGLALPAPEMASMTAAGTNDAPSQPPAP